MGLSKNMDVTSSHQFFQQDFTETTYTGMPVRAISKNELRHCESIRRGEKEDMIFVWNVIKQRERSHAIDVSLLVSNPDKWEDLAAGRASGWKFSMPNWRDMPRGRSFYCTSNVKRNVEEARLKGVMADTGWGGGELPALAPPPPRIWHNASERTFFGNHGKCNAIENLKLKVILKTTIEGSPVFLKRLIIHSKERNVRISSTYPKNRRMKIGMTSRWLALYFCTYARPTKKNIVSLEK